jgi:hypothetical protein
VNADTEPQVVPDSRRQPFLHLDTKEREWQRVHLPAAIRELILDDHRRRSTICRHVFDD